MKSYRNFDGLTPEKRRKMPYKDFLQSRYWARVRKMVWSRDDSKCQRCGQRGLDENGDLVYDMEVNHKTYKHRGDELMHLGDLELLCRDCHKKFHNPYVPVDDDIEMNHKRNRALKLLASKYPTEIRR